MYGSQAFGEGGVHVEGGTGMGSGEELELVVEQALRHLKFTNFAPCAASVCNKLNTHTYAVGCKSVPESAVLVNYSYMYVHGYIHVCMYNVYIYQSKVF